MRERVDGAGKTESREPEEETDSHRASDLVRESEHFLERDVHPRTNIGGGLLEQVTLVRQDQSPSHAMEERHPELSLEGRAGCD